MKLILKVLGILIMLSSMFAGNTSDVSGFNLIITRAIVFVIGLGIFILSNKLKSKDKLYSHRNIYIVKGTFLHDRQRMLGRIYKDYASDDEKEAFIKNVQLVAEPSNEYDSNAIAVYVFEKDQIGYIPRESTKDINLNYPYEALLTIWKDPTEYVADISIHQKLPCENK